MWTSFFQHLRGCGRDATMFIVALVSMLAGLIFVPAMGWLTWPILGALLAWLCVMMIRAVVRAARPEPKLGRLPPLCERDWRKARERLTRTDRLPARSVPGGWKARQV
jgi:uncharacterized membrane protein YccC